MPKDLPVVEAALLSPTLAQMEALLDTVERPGPVPVGAPGSLQRRAWRIGREFQAARERAERRR